MRKQDITRDAIQLKTFEKFVYSMEDWSSQGFFFNALSAPFFLSNSKKGMTKNKKVKIVSDDISKSNYSLS